MALVNGCNLPDDLYYYTEKHVWCKPLDNGNVRVGMTSVAAKMAGSNLSAVTVSARKIGKVIKQKKSLATVESSKFVGPVPAPVTGKLVAPNEALAENPNLAVNDPYGTGWIAEIEPEDWDGEKGSLVFGEDGLASYKAALEAEGISCD
jgi:glycine cleavage system H protein